MTEYQVNGTPVIVRGTSVAIEQWLAWQCDCTEPDPDLELTVVAFGDVLFTGSIKEVEEKLPEFLG